MNREECIALIVEQNVGTPGLTTGCSVACLKVQCANCPMRQQGVTLGKLRDEYHSKALPPPEEPMKDDVVRNPSRYELFTGVESIEVIARSFTEAEFRGFCLGNVMKYRFRAGKKDAVEQDLAKADFYVELFEKHRGLCRAE